MSELPVNTTRMGIMTDGEIRQVRALCESMGDGFAHYIDGTGRAAHELKLLVPRLLDEVETFAGYDKELAADGERTGRLVAAFEAERDALRAELAQFQSALDELLSQVELKSPSTGSSAKLADVMRGRYGREAAQWKANHDQRKEERDALKARLAVIEPVWAAARAWRSWHGNKSQRARDPEDDLEDAIDAALTKDLAKAGSL